jgi:hypothetical protein
MIVFQPFLLPKLPDGRHHLILLALTETVVKGQADAYAPRRFHHAWRQIPATGKETSRCAIEGNQETVAGALKFSIAFRVAGGQPV